MVAQEGKINSGSKFIQAVRAGTRWNPYMLKHHAFTEAFPPPRTTPYPCSPKGKEGFPLLGITGLPPNGRDPTEFTLLPARQLGPKLCEIPRGLDPGHSTHVSDGRDAVPSWLLFFLTELLGSKENNRVSSLKAAKTKPWLQWTLESRDEGSKPNSAISCGPRQFTGSLWASVYASVKWE